MIFETESEVVTFLEGLPIGKTKITVAPGNGLFFYETTEKYNKQFKKEHGYTPVKIQNGNAPRLAVIEKFPPSELSEEDSSRVSRHQLRSAISSITDRIEFDYEPKLLTWIRTYVYSHHKGQFSAYVASDKIVVERKSSKGRSFLDTVRSSLGDLPVAIKCDAAAVQSVRIAISQIRDGRKLRVTEVEGGCVIFDLGKVIADALAKQDNTEELI